MSVKRTKTWLVTGAARTAREARIATVKFLQTAPIARAWEIGKLQSAYPLHTAHLGHAPTAHPLLFSGMGYRPPYPTDCAAAADLVLTDEARHLAGADLYILTPQMCVTIAAAQTLTREDLELATEDDLPTPRGLVVLPHPLLVKSITGDIGDDRAYTWRVPAQIQRPASNGRKMQDAPAIRMSAYHDSYGPVRPDSFLDFAAMARVQGTPLPPLLLDAIRCHKLNCTTNPDQVHGLA